MQFVNVFYTMSILVEKRASQGREQKSKNMHLLVQPYSHQLASVPSKTHHAIRRLSYDLSLPMCE